MKRVEAADYRDLVQVSDPQLSPDGERVAFMRTVPRDAKRYESTVYLVPLGGDGPRRFTAEAGRDAEPRWSPSGDRLAFTSTRGGEEDDDRQQLYVVPADGARHAR